MDEALQYIYYTWNKVLEFLNGVFIDGNNTVTPFYVLMGVSILGILIAYLLPTPERK